MGRWSAFSTKWKTGELGGADFGSLLGLEQNLWKYGHWILIPGRNSKNTGIGFMMENISWRCHVIALPSDETKWWMVNQWGINKARILVGIGSKLSSRRTVISDLNSQECVGTGKIDRTSIYQHPCLDMFCLKYSTRETTGSKLEYGSNLNISRWPSNWRVTSSYVRTSWGFQFRPSFKYRDMTTPTIAHLHLFGRLSWQQGWNWLPRDNEIIWNPFTNQRWVGLTGNDPLWATPKRRTQAIEAVWSMMRNERGIRLTRPEWTYVKLLKKVLPPFAMNPGCWDDLFGFLEENRPKFYQLIHPIIASSHSWSQLHSKKIGQV